jgi:hypothetical protein
MIGQGRLALTVTSRFPLLITYYAESFQTMSILSFPVEINIMIIGEILNPKDGLHSSNDDTDTDANNPLHKAARRQRLTSFRRIACISKAWADLARIAFWKEIKLFSAPEVIALAHAIDKPSAKPTCIRSVCIRFAHFILHFDSQNHLAVEVLTCFPVVLRYLPAHLNILYVNCPYGYGLCSKAIYKCIQAACQDHTWTIQVPKLVIGARPLMRRDVFQHFAFARNVVQLVLNLDQYDTEKAFSSSLHPIQLESLIIRMTFDARHSPMSPVAKAVSQVLRSACTDLRSLVITLVRNYRLGPAMYDDLKVVKHILSICGPSINNLDLRAVRFSSSNISKELAEAELVVRCPALRCLRLNKFGVHPDFFHQLGCSELWQLEVTDMPQDDADASAVRGDGETLLNLLASLELPELANLGRLDITVDAEEVASHGYPSICMKEVWLSLENACAARNIACSIRHAKQTLQATS